jgi:hypothetical protein
MSEFEPIKGVVRKFDRGVVCHASPRTGCPKRAAPWSAGSKG